jgi:hypothetical protein
MLKREELLEIVNELNSCYAGSKVGYINGYHDQWFLGGYLNHYKNDLKELRFHFCQGRNTGRIKFNGGYEVTLNVADCKSREEVMEEFRLLDHHKRKEKERLESRCLSCLCALGRITGNCFPNESCGFKKISKKKGMSQIISNRESQSLRV